MSDSPRPDQRLGTVLVAQNKISTDRLEEFLSQHCAQDGKMGEVMKLYKEEAWPAMQAGNFSAKLVGYFVTVADLGLSPRS